MKPLAYYNENEPYAAAWLRELIARNLIAPGDVDERSINDVQGSDLDGYTQCHFFAGIGGWSYALRLAGWPDDRSVWTGSCPCQPFSSAGKRKGNSDDRHLWPEMFRLIRERSPGIIFGEQVEAAIRLGWLDGISADLERENYAIGSVVLGAHSVGAPHIRQRLFWVAESERIGIRREGHGATRAAPEGLQETYGERQRVRTDAGTIGGNEYIGLADAKHSRSTEQESRSEPRPQGCGIDRLEHTPGDGRIERRPEPSGRCVAHGCSDGWMGNPNSAGSFSRNQAAQANGHGHSTLAAGFWSTTDIIRCRDGKSRRVESGIQCLVDGIPFRLADGRTKEGVSRIAILKGIGNAIVPQVAAEFISAYMQSQEVA